MSLTTNSHVFTMCTSRKDAQKTLTADSVAIALEHSHFYHCLDFSIPPSYAFR